MSLRHSSKLQENYSKCVVGELDEITIGHFRIFKIVSSYLALASPSTLETLCFHFHVTFNTWQVF